MIASKTPLRKTNRVEGIIARKPTTKCAYEFLGLCIVSVLYYMYELSPGLT